MLKKVMAVALFVSDLEQSVKFYRDNLGLELNSKEEGFADFKNEGSTITLLEEKVVKPVLGDSKVTTDPNAPRHLILAWDAVENVDDLFNELKEKGVEFLSEPKTMEWGQRVAYFSDPDGNIWEISSWIKKE